MIESLTTDGPKFRYSGAGAWLKILGASFCHFTAQLLSTCNNQSINPATVGIFMYLQIVYAYLYDVFAFGNSLTSMQFIGIAILLTFSLASAFMKRCQVDDDKSHEASQDGDEARLDEELRPVESFADFKKVDDDDNIVPKSEQRVSVGSPTSSYKRIL